MLLLSLKKVLVLFITVLYVFFCLFLFFVQFHYLILASKSIEILTCRVVRIYIFVFVDCCCNKPNYTLHVYVLPHIN